MYPQYPFVLFCSKFAYRHKLCALFTYRNFWFLSFLYLIYWFWYYCCYILFLSLGRYQTKIRLRIVMIHGTFLLTISEGGVAYGNRYCNYCFVRMPITYETWLFTSSMSGSLPKSSLYLITFTFITSNTHCLIIF